MGWTMDYEGKDSLISGYHGFDPKSEEMRAVLIASGPDIKQSNQEIEPISNINVYHLMTRLLSIEGAPNNGTDYLSNLLL
jgi:hypothetical protein